MLNPLDLKMPSFGPPPPHPPTHKRTHKKLPHTPR
jgi:hypothetical protein